MNESFSQVTIKEENLSEDESSISIENNISNSLGCQNDLNQSSGNIRDILRNLKKVVTEQEPSIEEDEEDDSHDITNDSPEDLSYFFLENQEDNNEEDSENSREINLKGDSRTTVLGMSVFKEKLLQGPYKNKSYLSRGLDGSEKEIDGDNLKALSSTPKYHNGTSGNVKAIDPNSFYYKYYYGQNSRLNTPDISDPLSLPGTPVSGRSSTSHGPMSKRDQNGPFSKFVNPENRLKAVSSFYGFGQATNNMTKRAPERFNDRLTSKKFKASVQKSNNNESDPDDSTFENNSFSSVLKIGRPGTSTGNTSGITSISDFARGIPSMQYGNRLAGLMRELETLSPYPMSTYYDSYYQKGNDNTYNHENTVNVPKTLGAKEVEAKEIEASNNDSGYKLNVEAKYASMTVDEWEAQGEILVERVSKLLQKVIAFRRKKAQLVKTLDDIVDGKANELMAQEKELKGSLSRFGNKASEMVHALEDFTQPSKSSKDIENSENVVSTESNGASKEDNKICSAEPQNSNNITINQESLLTSFEGSIIVSNCGPSMVNSKPDSAGKTVEAILEGQSGGNVATTNEPNNEKDVEGNMKSVETSEKLNQEIVGSTDNNDFSISKPALEKDEGLLEPENLLNFM